MSIDRGFKLLDLYCGEGLAAWGYWRSGCFSEIVGVDIDAGLKPRYAFDFINGDALALDYDFLLQFDFIHASPPCQGYSKMTPPAVKFQHKRLVAATHLMLYATGKPYVIENVEGSGQDLRPNLVMDGRSVGLPIQRKRYFHVSTLPETTRMLRSSLDANVYVHGSSINRDGLIDAMGLKSMISEKRLRSLSMHGIEQGVPPIMTKWIAEMVIGEKLLIA